MGDDGPCPLPAPVAALRINMKQAHFSEERNSRDDGNERVLNIRRSTTRTNIEKDGVSNPSFSTRGQVPGACEIQEEETRKREERVRKQLSIGVNAGHSK